MESTEKRLCAYHHASIRNFKVNAFIDYMMVATDEEKELWKNVWGKYYVHQERHWEWIKFGECIRLYSLSHECFVVSRFTHEKKIPTMILDNPWLLTEQDKQVYRNANSTFWHLIFIRLQSIEDVQSFSQVSRLHHHVARRDMAYKPWIDGLLKSHYFYSNPFQADPLWLQFLKLSGLPKESWKSWVQTNIDCFFFANVSKGDYRMSPIPENAIFDTEKWSITSGGRQLIRDTNVPAYTIQTSSYTYPQNFLTYTYTMLRDNMQRIMRK